MRNVRRTIGGRGLHEGQEKEWLGCFLDDLRAFDINADQWTTAAQAKEIAAENARAGLRHAVGCPNVVGWSKDRIAQNKRARAGSLAIVD